MASKTNNGIPSMRAEDLRCTICPKSSQFSDLSHLLTHIASKQHLSTYFNIRIKASADKNENALLQQFNSWFEKWHMGDLLYERQQSKEKKKANNRANGRKVAAPLPAASIARTKYQPRDSVQAVRRETASATPEAFDMAPDVRSYTTNYQPFTWPALPPWMETDTPIKLESDDAPPSDPAEAFPPAYFLRRRRDREEADSAVGSSSFHSSTLLEDLNGEEKDIAKLKGTVWPGMSLFDSATPEMQRKRNQKKAVNVVVQLQATSVSVEPNEMIYSFTGDFLKQRTISGDPSLDGSPLRGETSPEPDTPELKKRRGPARRTREILSELDKNGNQPRRAQPRRKAPKKKYSEARSDESNDQITYDVAKYKKKNGISIHRDFTGPDITFDQPPLSMSCLTSGFGSRSGFDSAHRSMFGAPINRHYVPQNQMPSMFDFSTFGQMTNSFQPNHYGFPAASLLSHNIGHTPTFQQAPTNEPHANDGRSGFGQTLPSWDVFNADPRPADPSTFQGYAGFDLDNPDINPLFFHSDQVFPVNGEQHTDKPVKQEDVDDHESNADTISLASDQK